MIHDGNIPRSTENKLINKDYDLYINLRVFYNNWNLLQQTNVWHVTCILVPGQVWWMVVPV